jgi:hypothetical protein
LSVPERRDYAWGAGDWGSPRLAHLRYHPSGDERDLDVQTDQTARLVASMTTPGEAVLVLGRSELVNYASGTEPVGGYYRHYFYLLRTGILDRRRFLELVPSGTLRTLYDDPPRVLVDQADSGHLAAALPDIAAAISRHRYRLIAKRGVFRVYERPRPAGAQH